MEVRKLTDNKEDNKKGSVTFTFLCNRWFAKGEDDGAIVRELVPSKIVEESVDKTGKVSVAEHRVDAMLESKFSLIFFLGVYFSKQAHFKMFLRKFS